MRSQDSLEKTMIENIGSGRERGRPSIKWNEICKIRTMNHVVRCSSVQQTTVCKPQQTFQFTDPVQRSLRFWGCRNSLLRAKLTSDQTQWVSSWLFPPPVLQVWWELDLGGPSYGLPKTDALRKVLPQVGAKGSQVNTEAI